MDTAVVAVAARLNDALEALAKIPSNRETSLVKTKIQEALHWLTELA